MRAEPARGLMWSPILVGAMRFETSALLEACVAPTSDSSLSVWSVHRVFEGERRLVEEAIADSPDAAARAAERVILAWRRDGEILGPAPSGARVGKLACEGLS